MSYILNCNIRNIRSYALALGIVLSLVACSDKPQPSSVKGYSESDSTIIKHFNRALAVMASDPDSALTIVEEVYKMSGERGFHKGMIDSRMTKGMILMNKGMSGEAMTAFREAASTSKTYRPASLGLVNNNQGLIFLNSNEYDSAAFYFQLALQNLRKHAPENVQAFIMASNNLAAVYIQLNQKAEVLKYLEEAERLNQTLDSGKRDSREMCYIYVNKGEVYLDFGLFDKAEESFRRAVDIGVKHNESSRYVAHGRIGDVFLERGSPERAIPFFIEAMEMAKQDKNAHPYDGFLAPSYSLARAYYQLQQYRKAEAILVRAIALADSMKVNIDIEGAHLQLSAVYRALQLPWKALEETDKYVQLKDSFLSREKQKAVNQLEIKYRTAEKDKALAENQLLIVKQQNNIRDQQLGMAAIAVVVVVVLSLSIIIYRTSRNKQRLQEGKIRVLESEKQVDQLKAMVKGEEKERVRLANELHDNIVGQLAAIKMNFNAIQHQYRLDHIPGYNEALKQLSDAADDVRKTAHNLMPGVLLQGGLYGAVHHFCKKMSPHLNISFQYYGDLPKLDPEFELSCYRIIQELVQNVVKHAHAKNVVVQFNSNEEMLSLTVEDDGVGISQPAHPEHEGMGLKNISTRVNAFHGQMQVDSQPSLGTTVYIEFDVAALKQVRI